MTNRIELSKAVFIGGVGRSGTTVFHRMLAEHPNLAWISTLANRYPENPSINRLLMNLIDTPAAGKLLKRRFRPWECLNVWETHCKGFRRSFRDLEQTDVTTKSKEKIETVLAQYLTPKRNRILLKATGWSRISYLDEALDDIRYIHVIRDGRAVANSLINLDWWLGWNGPENWRWGKLPPIYEEEWRKFDYSFVALAGIQWKLLMDAAHRARDQIDRRKFIEIKYEDLCSNPAATIRSVCDFADLEWNGQFEKSISAYTLHSANQKWRTDLTVLQQNILNEVLGDYLSQYGYND